MCDQKRRARAAFLLIFMAGFFFCAAQQEAAAANKGYRIVKDAYAMAPNQTASEV